ncbi:MAG: hypothetical protein CM15mP75_0050 [Flammeovirgaceae bacterium]|nr:MAG: hypothetical protein CM15mP75_0050 [Flammeovirgaceae bacterium]
MMEVIGPGEHQGPPDHLTHGPRLDVRRRIAPWTRRIGRSGGRGASRNPRPAPIRATEREDFGLVLWGESGPGQTKGNAGCADRYILKGGKKCL